MACRHRPTRAARRALLANRLADWFAEAQGHAVAFADGLVRRRIPLASCDWSAAASTPRSDGRRRRGLAFTSLRVHPVLQAGRRWRADDQRSRRRSRSFIAADAVPGLARCRPRRAPPELASTSRYAAQVGIRLPAATSYCTLRKVSTTSTRLPARPDTGSRVVFVQVAFGRSAPDRQEPGIQRLARLGTPRRRCRPAGHLDGGTRPAPG